MSIFQSDTKIVTLYLVSDTEFVTLRKIYISKQIKQFMKKDLLYQVLYNQQKDFLSMNNLKDREKTMEVIKLLKLKLPTIITGMRRCGKSSLLKLIFNKLNLNKNDFLYINFNDERLINFNDENFQNILDYIEENNYKKKVYLFLDEIQEVKNWEKWVDRIKEKFPILITGPNSQLLSSEISTILTGRSLNVNLFPFNFSEYLNYKKIDLTNYLLDTQLQNKIKSHFKEYFSIGGMPKMIIERNNIILKELYENIIYRDIVRRFNPNLTTSIKEISIYLLSNISSDVSLRTLSKISGIKNLGVLSEIFASFEKAFLFFRINKFDYSVKKQIQNPKKVYSIDIGFPNKLGFKFSKNSGNVLENLVAISFKQRGFNIYYHREKTECDFVIQEKNKITKAIQVCYKLDDKNKEREIKGLLEAMDKFKLKEGLILTYDDEEEFKMKNEKIKIKPVWKWLLEDKFKYLKRSIIIPKK